MVALYLCSTEARAGKTMLAVGLAQHFRRSGLSVGYMKAVSILSGGEQLEAGIAGFVKRVVGLGESVDLLAPVQIAAGGHLGTAVSGQGGALERLKSAYQEISKGKDVVIVEGGGNLAEGAALGVSGPEVVSALSAKALLVAKYHPDNLVSAAYNAKQSLHEALVGVVVNSVPIAQAHFCASAVNSVLNQNTAVFGSLPQVRSLMGVSIGELVRHLGAEVLCCADRLDLAVENVMIGTINYEDARGYFSRKANKVVVTSVGRPDMQLAALATSTHCLLVVGDESPDPYVLSRAVEIGVPVIKAKGDTISVLDRLQPLFDNSRFHQREKVETAEHLLAEHLDWAALYSGLGLPAKAA